MPKLKTRKSVTKRFKITKNGKILRMATGLDHSRAKQSGNTVRKGRKLVHLSKAESKRIRKIIKK